VSEKKHKVSARWVAQCGLKRAEQGLVAIIEAWRHLSFLKFSYSTFRFYAIFVATPQRD
jgi:hypothetical protein